MPAGLIAPQTRKFAPLQQPLRFLPKDKDAAAAKKESDEAAPLLPAAPVAADAAAAATPATPTEGYNYSPEFVRRRLLVFVGIVVG